MQVNPRNDRETLARALVPVAGESAEAAIMTAGERLIQQGRAEGQINGQRMLLRRLLEQRFGPLPARDAARLEAAGSEELERWALRMLQAERLESVFAE